MRKILLPILVGVVWIVASCSNNEEIEIPTGTSISDRWSELAGEYTIDRARVTIDGYTIGVDTNFVFFNGRIDSRLWIGGYEKKTKKNILDWTESTKLDTLLKADIGFGEKAEYIINRWDAYPFIQHENSLCFLLHGTGSGIAARYTDLYFLKENKVNAKYRKLDDFRYGDLFKWYDGILLAKSHNGLSWQTYDCYDMNGTYLFSSPIGNTPIDNCTPINFEEYLKHTFDDSTNKTISISKSNLKTGETIWKNNKTIDSSEETIRVDDISIEKGNLLWVYTVSYTRYSGEKRIYRISVNIQTGEMQE